MSTPINQVSHPVGRFMVMRHSNTGKKRMHCSAVHDSYDAALDEARRLYAEMAASGVIECGFYILRITDRVGVFHNVLEQGGKSA